MIGGVREVKLEGAGGGAGHVEGDAVNVDLGAVDHDFLDVAGAFDVLAGELESLVAVPLEVIVAIDGVVREVDAAVEGLREADVEPALMRGRVLEVGFLLIDGSGGRPVEAEGAVRRLFVYVLVGGVNYPGV